jgi:hypothetical protein
VYPGCSPCMHVKVVPTHALVYLQQASQMHPTAMSSQAALGPKAQPLPAWLRERPACIKGSSTWHVHRWSVSQVALCSLQGTCRCSGRHLHLVVRGHGWHVGLCMQQNCQHALLRGRWHDGCACKPQEQNLRYNMISSSRY